MSARSLLFVLAASVGLAGTPARAETSPLVTTEWLEKNLDNPKVRVVEVSVEPGVFERGHVPNAQNIVWHTDLVETVTRDIASPEKFQALARRLGVDKDTTVVLYGDNNNWFAAWGAWVFAQYGLVDNVKLLDGGRKKWEAEKRPFDVRVTDVAPSRFSVGQTAPNLRARLPEVLAVAKGERDAKILDIRSPDEFSGKIIAPQGIQELADPRRPHPRLGERALGARRQRGRHPQVEGGAEEALCRGRRRRLEADHHLPAASASARATPGSCSRASSAMTSKNYDGSWTEYGNTVGVPIVNLAGTVWGGK